MSGGEIERPKYTTAYIEALHGDPVWEAIWTVMREWDISRGASSGYHGVTGDDVTMIYEAVEAAFVKRLERKQ